MDDSFSTIQGGVVILPAFTQIVYLDFDGELTKYSNPTLNLDIDVAVEDSCLSPERIKQITDSLNEQYASQNVHFVTERPEDADYSTIYVGKTSSFSQYGTFAGLAEAIDSGNQNQSDNAFVILDSTSNNARIISTISHELAHLLGTLNHGGEGLERYAYKVRYDDSSGITSTRIVLNNDSMYVHSGGTENSTTVNSSGWLYVFSGGTATSTTVNSGGWLGVSCGGKVSGSLQIESGATVSAYTGTIIDFTVAEQENPSAALINNRGLISGGSNADCTITVKEDQSNGTYQLAGSADGFSKTITVKTESSTLGSFAVGEPFTKDNVTYSLSCNSGNLALNIAGTSSSGPVISGSSSISNATITSATVTNGGRLYLLNRGIANHVIVESSSYLYVSSGGMVNDANLSGYLAHAHVSHGGSACKTSAREQGELYISNGGTAVSTTIDDLGSMYVFQGGFASNTVIKSGGRIDIYSGANCSKTTILSEGRLGGFSFSGDVYFDKITNGVAVISPHVTITGETMTVSSGGIAEAPVFTSGQMYVSNGGIVRHAMIGKEAIMTILSGGVADSTTTYRYGYATMVVSGGGIAKNTSLNGWKTSLSIFNGGIHSGYLSIEEDENIVVSAYQGAIIDFTVAEQTIPSTALINNWSLIKGGSNANYTITIKANQSNGTYRLADGASGFNKTITVKTESATLGSFAIGESFTKDNVTYSLSCNSGNLALNIAKASSSGPVISGSSCISNATITSATVINGGILYLKNRGIANHTTIASDGGMYVSYGGTANSTIMNDTNGWMEVYNGGVVNNTLINIGDVTIFNGGTANGTTISSGYLGIESGGRANNTILNGGSDHLYAPILCISNGGIANRTTVNSGGQIEVSSGGVLSGNLQFEFGAAVSVYQGAIIDFTVAEQTIPSTVLVNNWSLIEGRNDADYTLTVRANQASGTYILANGAADFNETLTVKTNNNTPLGTLAVGESKVLGKSNYTLSKYSNTLALTVTAPAISDYNKSSKSDMIQFVNGKVHVMHDTASGYIQTPAINDITGWNVVEIRRDLTGDGYADIQITSDDGAGSTWVATLRNDYLKTGCITLNYQFIGAYDNRLWSYLGSADFNGDGKSEILMVQTEAGKDQYGHRNVAGWITDEETCQWTDNIWLGALNDGWNIAGTADVTGDGADNVILRGADGMIGYWKEFGGMPEDIVTLKNAGNRVMITTGDFDGDGVQDFLWQSCDNSGFSTWTNINNSLIDTAIGKIGDLGGNWTFAGTGDYNGDRKDEILWCDTTTYRTAYSEANKENFTKLTLLA